MNPQQDDSVKRALFRRVAFIMAEQTIDPIDRRYGTFVVDIRAIDNMKRAVLGRAFVV